MTLAVRLLHTSRRRPANQRSGRWSCRATAIGNLLATIYAGLNRRQLALRPSNWSGSLGSASTAEGAVAVITESEVPFASLAPAEERQPVRDVPQAPGYWRDSLSAYARPRRLRSLVDFVTSVVGYLVMSVVTYFALQLSPALALALAPITAVVPAAHVHCLPRLLARFISRVPTRERVAGHDLRAARALAVRSLAPRPRCSPRDVR